MLSGILNSWFLIRSVFLSVRSGRQPADALFPVAAKMTFEAPVRTAANLPWRLFLATDRRSSAS